jgi:hypothetical protein
MANDGTEYLVDQHNTLLKKEVWQTSSLDRVEHLEGNESSL